MKWLYSELCVCFLYKEVWFMGWSWVVKCEWIWGIEEEGEEEVKKEWVYSLLDNDM